MKMNSETFSKLARILQAEFTLKSAKLLVEASNKYGELAHLCGGLSVDECEYTFVKTDEAKSSDDEGECNVNWEESVATLKKLF